MLHQQRAIIGNCCNLFLNFIFLSDSNKLYLKDILGIGNFRQLKL